MAVRGGIILSNRLRAMQEAAENFGDSIAGLKEQQRKIKMEDADRAAAANSRAISDRANTASAEASELSLADFKGRAEAKKQAEGYASELANFGTAVPDSTIDVGDGMLPGFQGMQSPRPVMADPSEGLKDRIRASWMNAEAKSKGESSAFTGADVKRQREEAATKKSRETEEYNLGIDKTKADIDRTKAGTETEKLQAQKLKKEIDTIAAGGLDPEKVATIEGKLRGEFINQNKVFMDVRDAWSRVNASGDDAAGDLALIFNYMKMLDPGSTVREGEFATAQNAAGVPERILNAYNNSLEGTRLSKGQRDQFKGQAGKLYDSQKDIYTSSAKTYMGLAADYGVQPGRVVVDLEGGVKSAPAPGAAAGSRSFKSAKEAMAAGLPPGTVVMINGMEAEM